MISCKLLNLDRSHTLFIWVWRIPYNNCSRITWVCTY